MQLLDSYNMIPVGPWTEQNITKMAFSLEELYVSLNLSSVQCSATNTANVEKSIMLPFANCQ